MIKVASYTLLASLFFLFSCQKKDVVGVQAKYTGNPMVNFSNYMDDNGNFGYYKANLQIKDSFLNTNIEIKLTNTTGTAPNDIYIYLMKVDALVSSYNTANGTTLESVSNASAALEYDFSKPVILKKGARAVTVPLRVNPLKLDLSKQNAIGIAIARVEGADLNAGVESKLVVEIQALNQYAGNYVANGYFYHPSSSRAITNRPRTGVTAGANSIIMELGDLGSLGYFALLTVNGTNVTISVAPGAAGGPYTMFTSGLPTTNPGYPPSWPSSSNCNNTYNPTTHTFYLRYGYMGGTGWRVTEEVLTKQ